LKAIERRPAVVDVQGKETIAIRDEMFLSHTYDHRIIDGAIGGNFLKYLAKTLNRSTFKDYYTQKRKKIYYLRLFDYFFVSSIPERVCCNNFSSIQFLVFQL
jgi:hypothetical protein